MASRAVKAALEDAGVAYDAVEQAYAGYVFGDSTCGQRALYEVGMTGIDLTSTTTLHRVGADAGCQAIKGGVVDCVSWSVLSRWSAVRSAANMTTD